MKFLKKVLQRLVLMCGNCSAWRSSTVSTHKRLEYGTNVGGMLMMDPFYIVTKDRVCNQCGRLMSSKTIRYEEVV